MSDDQRLCVAVDRKGGVWAALADSTTRRYIGSVSRPNGWWDVKTSQGDRVGLRRENGRPWSLVASQRDGAVLLIREIYPDTAFHLMPWSFFSTAFPGQVQS